MNKKQNGVYIIAEAGVNHNGQKDLAFRLVDEAANSGVDAVKFQTFDAKKLAAVSVPKAAYQTKNTGVEETQLEMLSKLELPKEWHLELQAYSKSKGVEFLSTAFDLNSLMFLENLGMPLFKVPSGELTNSPLLWRFAKTGKPLILSTGMAKLAEVEEALAVITHALNADVEPSRTEDIWHCWGSHEHRQCLKEHVTLLHCTSQYPAPAHEVNLRAMDTLAATFGLQVGYSDHTEGTLIPVAAVARGARVIEKHFTLDRGLPGPDHKASLEPTELRRMVRDIRTLEVALGDGMKVPQESEWDTRLASRQQVIAARDIHKGAEFSRQDLTTARCGMGVPANVLWDLLGKTAHQDYLAGTPIL